MTFRAVFWVFERQKCDPCGAALSETGKELRGAANEGVGLLFGYGGPEGGCDPALHSGTRG